MGILKKIGYKVSFLIKIMEYKISYGNRFQIGNNLAFRKRFSVNISKNGNLKIGNDVFFNDDCSLNCKLDINVGDDCIFGQNVKIYDHNHSFSDYLKPIRKQGYSLKPVKIGDNCWIGSNVVILPGTIIGSNSIIGAGSVISGEIPEGVIVTSERELQFVRRRVNGNE
jgi:protein CpsH